MIIRVRHQGLLLVYLIVIVLSLCYVTITMIVVYMAVRKVEKDVEKYTFASYTSKKKDVRMSHRVMVQGILYSAALTSLCVIYTLGPIYSMYGSSYAIEVLGSILLPLQGFWNALIYMVPLFRQIVRKNRCKS